MKASMKTNKRARQYLEQRYKRGQRGELYFLLALLSGFLVLFLLVLSITNQAFGVVAIKEKVDPTTLVTDGRQLEQLSNLELTTILQSNLSKGKMQALLLKDLLPADVDRTKLGTDPISSLISSTVQISLSVSQKKFSALTADDIATILSVNLSQQQLVEEVLTEVVGREVIESWPFIESVFGFNQIQKEVQRKANGENLASSLTPKQVEQIRADYSAVRLEWKAWFDLNFIQNPTSSVAAETGIRGALIGTLLILLIAIVPSALIGVSTAIYLEEYATEYNKRNRWYRFLNNTIGMTVRTLAGVPSIIYGLLGLIAFAQFLAPITSGQIFGFGGGNGKTVLTAGLTLGTLILPVIIISSQEAIKAVPYNIREACYGLGANKPQTIYYHVLPSAMPGIMTGIILSLSRAIGETAPLVVIGAAVFLSKDPNGPFQPFTTLSIQIFNWASQPDDQFRHAASAAIIVLGGLLICFVSIAIVIRSKFARRVQ